MAAGGEVVADGSGWIGMMPVTGVPSAANRRANRPSSPGPPMRKVWVQITEKPPSA